MSINNVDIFMTALSIFVTIVSIGCSIWSFCSAKKSKKYKEGILILKDTLDLRSLLSQFLSESEHFMEKTRNKEWYRGIDVNVIISPLSRNLMLFGSIYHLISDSSNLKLKVHKLQNNIQHYDTASDFVRAETNDLITDIVDILHSVIHKTTDETSASL